MDALSMNTLRIVLVGASALAAVIAAVFGMWIVTGVLTVGVLAHGALWRFLQHQRDQELDRLHDGVESLLRHES